MSVTTTGLAMANIASKLIHKIPGGDNKTDSALNNFGSTENSSLSDFAKLARVEPITLIDTDCVNLEFLPDVLQTTLSIFTGYYLQAVSVLGAIDSVKVVKTLSALNPSNSFNNSLEGYTDKKYGANDGTWKQSMEAYRWAMPMGAGSVSMEDAGVSINRQDVSGERVREVVNLGVGKIISVTLSDSSNKESKISIPISIRLATNTISNKGIADVLTNQNKDTGFIERFHYWRAGRIEFFRDLVWCQDLIDEKKRLMVDDKTGAYTDMVNRANKGVLKNILGSISRKVHGTTILSPSLATSSNIAIISDSTAKEIEERVGMKLSKATTRNNIYKSGYLMLLVVIDKQYERVTIYHRGVDVPTTLSLRDIKVSNKGSGPDIMDIFKALGMGQPASL